MSVNTEKTTAAKKTVTKKAATKETAVNKTPTIKEEPVRRKQIPLDTMVACTNLFPGTLIYISRKQNGYEITWENQGDVDYLELGELVSMRNSQRAFFEKNWIGIDDDDILDGHIL